ncbi:MAG: prephenate dehydrogenase [Propionibacteriaceae bacterium]|jgi:prephenate dehydrogenase|nr:prephenate dehydrogenase [Propionibacteriaceae bacterium]
MGIFDTEQRTISPALIIGTGMIGTSIGLALTKAGVPVYLRDSDPAHVEAAEALGAGSAALPLAEEVHLVVVAVPPEKLAEQVAEALSAYPEATVTDVGSVKSTVLKQLHETDAEAELYRYCGSHPMAGSEKSGPLAAKADMFVDRTWVVTPHDSASAHAVLDVRELAQTCGARITTLGAAHHDEAVAQVSHLPQLVSSLLAGMLTDVPPEHLKLAGQGLRDTTRIADSNPGLWRQIIEANSEAVHSQLEILRDHLNWLLDGFNDGTKLEAFLAEGRAGRQSLPGKHGTAAQAFAQLAIEIPDEVGALAGIFAAIKDTGINIEDVAIDHDQNRDVGYLEVAVAPDKADALKELLLAAGWRMKEE